LVPAFEQDGVDGLVLRTGELLKELLFPEAPFGKEERKQLTHLLLDDVAAIKRQLDQHE